MRALSFTNKPDKISDGSKKCTKLTRAPIVGLVCSSLASITRNLLSEDSVHVNEVT